jgi:hypothetical protein
MRSLIISTLLCATALSTSACLAADTAATAFDNIKGMAGEWVGKDDDGEPATLTMEVTSGGTAVMEKLTPGDHPCMISMYHLDGDKLMMTHYCARNNQPRLRATSIDTKKNTVAFDFIDATNMATPQDGHIHKLTLMHPDSEHLNEQWSWREGDKESAMLFQFKRKEKGADKK